MKLAVTTIGLLIGLSASAQVAHEADKCELYVEDVGFGAGVMDGASLRWVDAFLRVDAKTLLDERGETVTGAGTSVRSRLFMPEVATDGTAAIRIDNGERIVKAAALSPESFRVSYRYEVLPSAGLVSSFEELVEFSVFVDTVDTAGQAHRYWLPTRGRGFSPTNVLGGEGDWTYAIGEGWVTHPDGASWIYDQRSHCAR